MSFYSQYATLLVLALAAAALYAGILLANRILRPSVPSPLKLSTYECGVEAVGTGWSQTNIRYYVFAFLFVIFDVEAVFVFPWAVLLGEQAADAPVSAVFALVAMLVFLVTLLEGLLYAWRKGVLLWD